jgi:O-antigen/teichoic acid export membrane protein
MIVGAAAAIALLVAASPLARVLFEASHRHQGASLIRVLAPFLPFATGTTVALAGTRGMGIMQPFVRIQNLGIPALRVLSIAVVVMFGFGTMALGLAWGMPVALGLPAALIALHTLLGRVERRSRGTLAEASPLPVLAREFWRFSGPRGVAALITVALGWIDVLLVGALRSAPEAGVYAAVSRFIGVGTIALQATAFAIAPQISALLARDRRGEASRLFASATGWVVAASWPVYLSLAIFAPLLLRMFGPGFAAGQDSLTILALAMLVYVGVGNNKTVLLMAGGSGLNVVITGSWLVISLLLDFILIPRYGIEGAAVAYAVAIVGENLTTSIAVARRVGITPAGKGVLVASVAAVGCYGGVGMAARWMLGPSFVSFLLFGAVATGLYLAVLRRYRHRLDVEVLVRVLRRRRRRGSGRFSAAPGGTRRSG